MKKFNAKFAIGQVIHHKLFGYRGVIADVDATFQGLEEWYHNLAKRQPQKNKPWYHVLVDGSDHITYVAERNLEVDAIDPNIEPIHHPELSYFFTGYQNGKYLPRRIAN